MPSNNPTLFDSIQRGDTVTVTYADSSEDTGTFQRWTPMVGVASFILTLPVGELDPTLHTSTIHVHDYARLSKDLVPPPATFSVDLFVGSLVRVKFARPNNSDIEGTVVAVSPRLGIIEVEESGTGDLFICKDYWSIQRL